MTTNQNPTPVTTTAEDAQEVAADLRKLIDSAPAHIWLDLGEGAAEPGDVTFRDLREVSWSEENATGVGIKYVRAPVAVATSDAEMEAYPPLPEAVAHSLGLAKYAHSSNIIAAHEFTPDTEHADEWEALHTASQMREYVDADRKERQLAACNFCLAEAAKARTALPIDFKQATDQGGWQHVPEGCTPADARMLRAANHGLADENSRLREALQFYADGNHFAVHEEDAWDTVSGESANFYEDEANTATVEDGSVAKMAMALQSEAAPTLLGVADGDAS